MLGHNVKVGLEKKPKPRALLVDRSMSATTQYLTQIKRAYARADSPSTQQAFTGIPIVISV